MFYPIRPRIVIEHRNDRFVPFPTIRAPQATPKNLSDKQLAVEGAFLVRNDLENILHVPAFTEHRDRHDPFDLARRTVHGSELGNIRLVLCRRCNAQNFCRRLVRLETFPLLQELCNSSATRSASLIFCMTTIVSGRMPLALSFFFQSLCRL